MEGERSGDVQTAVSGALTTTIGVFITAGLVSPELGGAIAVCAGAWTTVAVLYFRSRRRRDAAVLAGLDDA